MPALIVLAGRKSRGMLQLAADLIIKAEKIILLVGTFGLGGLVLLGVLQGVLLLSLHTPTLI